MTVCVNISVKASYCLESNMSREAREQEIIRWLEAFKYMPQTQENLMIKFGLELNLEQIRAEREAA